MAEEILIGSLHYSVYATVEEADDYLAAAIHADTWRADTTDTETKQRALITATRLLDRQSWRGDKTDSDQALENPRTGIDPYDYDNVVSATIELALALVDGSEAQNETTANKIVSLKAGSVSLQFLPGADGVPTRFPKIVQELIGRYIGGDSSSIGPKATGVDGESIFPLDLSFTRGF